MLRFIVLIAFIAISLPTAVNAQKVKRLKRIEVKLDQLPLDPLGGYFRTYSLQYANFDAIKNITGKPTKKINKDYYDLNRYNFTDSQGDFEVYISFGDNFVPTRTTATKSVQTGTREAPVQDTQSYYNLTLQIPLSMELRDGKRQLIRKIDLSEFQTSLDFEFGPFGTDAELAEQWRTDGEKATRGQLVKYLDQAFQYSATKLRSEIDSIKVTRNLNFVTIKKAEKYGIADLVTDANKASDALEAFAKNGDRNALTRTLKPLVIKWRKAPDKYDPKNKKEEDIRYAFSHNLTLAAYLTGDLEAAEFGVKAGFDWGKNSSWYQDLRRAVDLKNERKRQSSQAWKPTEFTDVFQLRQPEFRRLKVSSAGPIKTESYLVSRDTVFTSFRFTQMRRGKVMPEIRITDDTQTFKYNPLQMRAIFDGEHFYEATATPLPGNNSLHWMVVEILATFDDEGVKLGRVERGKSAKENSKTFPEEYIIFGKKIRRPVNLSGADFTKDFNAGILDFFGPEYPEVAQNARAKKYSDTPGGYQILAADLAARK